MRRLSLLAIVAALLPGCPPTLSRPRGDEHIRSMQEGEAALSHHRDEEAVTSFERAAGTAERRVDRDEAEYEQAMALERLGRFDEAVVLLDRIGDRKPSSRRTGRAIYDAARLRYEDLNQREAGLAGFERVVREHPEDGLASVSVHRVVRHWVDAGDRPGAIYFCDRLYAEVGTTQAGDDLLRAKADQELASGNRRGARETLERLVHEHPYPYGHSWDNALLALSDMDLEDGDARAAIVHLEKIIDENEETNLVGSYTLSSMPEAQLRIARIYRDRLHDLDDASEAFEDVGEKFPRSILRDDALYEAGAMWVDAGNVRRGCGYLERVVDDFDVGHARRLSIVKMRAACPDRLPERLREETPATSATPPPPPETTPAAPAAAAAP